MLKQVDWIEYLAFHPEISVKGEPFKNGDNSLKGLYICKYRNANDKLVILVPEHEWVEICFSVPALAYVQQVAYAGKTSLSTEDESGNTTTVGGFVSVKNDNVTI